MLADGLTKIGRFDCLLKYCTTGLVSFGNMEGKCFRVASYKHRVKLHDEDIEATLPEYTDGSLLAPLPSVRDARTSAARTPPCDNSATRPLLCDNLFNSNVVAR